MSASDFNVEETVILYESIPGYISSGALLSSVTVEAGTYVIYKIAEGSRHPINISKTGQAAGSWVDVTKLYKIFSGFFAKDRVYVNNETNGYASSISTSATTTIDPDYYVVYQVVNGSKHPVNISTDGKTEGF